MDRPYEMTNLATGTEQTNLLQALSDAEVELKTLEATPPPKRTEEETKLANRVLSSVRTLIEALKKDYAAGDYAKMAKRLAAWEADNAGVIGQVEQAIQAKRLSLTPIRGLIDYVRNIATEAGKL